MEVVGPFKIRRASAGAGKVLTSDSNGVADWQTPGLGGLPYWQKRTQDGPDNTYAGNAAAHIPMDTSKWRLNVVSTGKPMLVGGTFLCSGQALMGVNLDGVAVDLYGNHFSYHLAGHSTLTGTIGPIVVPMSAGSHTLDVTLCTAVGGVVYDRSNFENNVFWAIELSGGVGPQGPSGGTAPYVTSLPASPVDGQECMYLAGSSIGVWHLRYRASSPLTYKWEVLGGAPLYAEKMTTCTMTAATVWHDGNDPGPQFTIPVAGDYMMNHGFRPYIATANNYLAMSYQIGATAAVSADWCLSQAGANIDTVHVSRTRLKTFAAGIVIAAKYNCSAGGTYYAEERWMQATPVRVG